MEPSRPSATVLAAFGTMTTIAGLNFIAVRFSNQELAPFWGAGLRFGLAAVLLGLVLVARRTPLPRGPELRTAVLFGLLAFGAAYALAYWALVDAPAALASVMTALVPLLTLMMAAGVGLEKVSARALAGGLVATAGIGVIFREQLGGPVPALALLALLAMAMVIAGTNVLVKRSRRGDPWAFNAVAMAVGTLVLLALSLASSEPWALPRERAPALAVAYLVVVGSIPLFMLFLYVQQRWTASGVAYQFVLMPLVTIAAAAVLAGEAITMSLLAGAALVALGVYVGALGRAAPKPAPSPGPPASDSQSAEEA